MDWLNYHHLYYFWIVAREGSIAGACEKLHVAQPTVSHQLKQLERAMGQRLFERAGRGLRLTDVGQLTYRYADEIFALGRELSGAVRGVPSGKAQRFTVGVPDGISKLIVYRLLRPALQPSEGARLVCREGSSAELLQQLAGHELDLVLSDTPASATVSVKAYSHLLGQCGVSFYASPKLAPAYRSQFPESLNGAPVLLPTGNTMLRRGLDQWLDEQEIRPRVVAEFEDSALLKTFGQEGLGLFPAPAAIRTEVERQYRVQLVGTLEDLQERYYAISVERRVKHPAVMSILRAARQELFQ